jgi:hypothetical protein
MGWNSEDAGPREEAKLAVQLTRVEAYKLIKALSRLTHPEKGPVLVKMADELYSLLDRIDGQLLR